MTATTANMVKGLSVTDVAIFAVNMISFSPMTETSAVSLTRLIMWLPNAGSAMRHACGNRTSRNTCQAFSPTERAASICPRSTPRNAPRKLSVAYAPAMSASAREPAQNGGMSTNRASGSTSLAMAVSVTALPK